MSSLTIDDENRLAPALLRGVAALLRAFPLAYTLRIETAGGQIFEHQEVPGAPGDGTPVRPPDVPPRMRIRHGTLTPFRY